MDSAVVVFTDEGFLRISSVQNAIREVESAKFQSHDPLIFTKASSLGKLPLDASSVEFAIFFYRSIEFPSHQFLEDVAMAVKPDGVVLVCPLESLTETIEEAISSIKRRLLIVGFKDVQVTHKKSVMARRVSWAPGSSFPIKGSLNKLPEIQVDSEMDLIDEDTLLTAEDLVKPEITADCGVESSKKACKNCTCGRSSEGEGEALTLPTVSDDMLNNPQSNCGSCGLGDAFRCGTCPYKGLPPFKLGEKVLLPSNFLTADI